MATDLSDKGNHGELHNFNFTEESGYVDGGLKFDGVDDYIEVENFPSLPQLTLETSFMMGESSGLGGIIKGNNGSWMGNEWGFRDNGNNHSLYYSYGAGIEQLTLWRNPSEKRVVHAIISNTEIKLYVNGEFITSENKNYDIRFTNQSLYIGMAYASSYGKYLYHSVKIYNRPLSEEEIQHNYQIEKERHNL